MRTVKFESGTLHALGLGRNAVNADPRLNENVLEFIMVPIEQQ